MTRGTRQELGRRVRLARKLAKLTQVELCGKAGITQPFLSEIETGKVGTSQTTRNAIAAALGISAIDLFHDDEAAA